MLLIVRTKNDQAKLGFKLMKGKIASVLMSTLTLSSLSVSPVMAIPSNYKVFSTSNNGLKLGRIPSSIVYTTDKTGFVIEVAVDLNPPGYYATGYAAFNCPNRTVKVFDERIFYFAPGMTTPNFVQRRGDSDRNYIYPGTHNEILLNFYCD